MLRCVLLATVVSIHVCAQEQIALEYEEAARLSKLARDKSDSIQILRDKEEISRAVKEAEDLFAQAISRFQAVPAMYRSALDEMSGLAGNPERMQRRNSLLETFLRSIDQVGWTHLYWSELYHWPAVSDAQKERY